MTTYLPVTRASRQLTYASIRQEERLRGLDLTRYSASIISCVLDVTGGLKTGALERALNDIVRRHESLRTTFHWHEGQLFQRINQSGSAECSMHADGGEDRLRGAMRRPFDLETGPLLRVEGFNSGTKLVIAVPHMVFDARSKVIFYKELGLLYSYYAGFDVGLELDPPTYHFVDYSTWQREALSEGFLEGQRSYWRTKLNAINEPFTIPPDVGRKPGRVARSIAQRLDGNTVATVNQLARQFGTSPYVVLLSAFAVVASSAAARSDLVLWSIVSTRTHLEFKDAIGYYLNNVVLREEVAHTATFADVIRSTKGCLLGALGNCDYPVSLLRQEFLAKQGGQIPSRLMFQLGDAEFPIGQSAVPSMKGLTVGDVTDPDEFTGLPSQIDMVIGIFLKEASIHWVFDSTLYSDQRVSLLADHLMRVVQIAGVTTDMTLRKAGML